MLTRNTMDDGVRGLLGKNSGTMVMAAAASMLLASAGLAQTTPLAQSRTTSVTTNAGCSFCGPPDNRAASDVAPDFAPFTSNLSLTSTTVGASITTTAAQVSSMTPGGVSATGSFGYTTNGLGRTSSTMASNFSYTFTVDVPILYTLGGSVGGNSGPGENWVCSASLTRQGGAIVYSVTPGLPGTTAPISATGVLLPGVYTLSAAASFVYSGTTSAATGDSAYNVTAAFVALPAGDLCAAPIDLLGTGAFDFDNRNASTDGLSGGGCTQANRDLWYRWTAPSSEGFVISTCEQTDVDTVIYVYSGSGCPGTPPVVCLDDICGLQTSVCLSATAGQTYTIRLGTFGSRPGGTGTFEATRRSTRPAVQGVPVFNPANFNMYYAMSGSSWHDAEVEAKRLGGHLVTINNAAENTFVASTFAAIGANAWIGLNDEAIEGVYVWSSGDASTYRNWFPGEPNNAGNSDFIAINLASGQWVDFPQSSCASNGPSIVEVETPVVLGEPVVNPANGHVYYLISPGTWAESQAAAVALGGHLVTINNAAENAWVHGTFGAGTRDLWLGFTDQAVEGQFVWTSGQTPGYTNWRAGEPNNVGNEDFAYMVAASGQWNDATGAAVASIHAVVEVEAPGVLAGPFRRPGSCGVYFLLDRSSATQAAARADAMGGTPIIIDDPEENEWVRQAIANAAGPRRIWLGYDDRAMEGMFLRADGIDVDYVNFAPGEPNNDGGTEHFLELSPATGLWNDVPDFFPAAFIFGTVEIPQPPCPCDWNVSGRIDSQDYFDFLSAFFGTSADFNCDGTTNSQDYFDFLACFFTPPSGCGN